MLGAAPPEIYMPRDLGTKSEVFSLPNFFQLMVSF